MPRTRTILVALSGAVMLACVGCGEGGGSGKAVSYRDTARANYQKGMGELRDENYPEAIKYFAFVKNKYPFSRFATLAELRAADAFFAQDKFLEAIDAYKLFMKFHPTHPQVLDGYAAYRIAQSYVEQMPSDWFLVPPSYEKDQSATRDATRELKIFLRSYRKSKYLPKLKKLYRQAVRKLADHELYVAQFYLERDKPKATIMRLEAVLKRFPEAGVHPEVMLLLGKTYLKLDKRGKARTTFAALIQKYPDDHHAAKAKLYLAHLDRRN